MAQHTATHACRIGCANSLDRLDALNARASEVAADIRKALKDGE